MGEEYTPIVERPGMRRQQKFAYLLRAVICNQCPELDSVYDAIEHGPMNSLVIDDVVIPLFQRMRAQAPKYLADMIRPVIRTITPSVQTLFYDISEDILKEKTFRHLNSSLYCTIRPLMECGCFQNESELNGVLLQMAVISNCNVFRCLVQAHIALQNTTDYPLNNIFRNDSVGYTGHIYRLHQEKLIKQMMGAGELLTDPDTLVKLIMQAGGIVPFEKAVIQVMLENEANKPFCTTLLDLIHLKFNCRVTVTMVLLAKLGIPDLVECIVDVAFHEQSSAQPRPIISMDYYLH
jgi:hypothetical protein